MALVRLLLFSICLGQHCLASPQKGTMYLLKKYMVPFEKTHSNIVGVWKFTGFYYQDQYLPPINPDLRLIFLFDSEGGDILYWSRAGEKGFCMRRGIYQMTGDRLVDEVTWVHPNNKSECSKDPDMQLGKKTDTEVHVEANKFVLKLTLQDQPFHYIFERTQLIDLPWLPEVGL